MAYIDVLRIGVSPYPLGHPKRHLVQVLVEARGNNRWVIVHNGQVLNAAGGWDVETLEDRNDPTWQAKHSWSWYVALNRANQIVNDMAAEAGHAAEEDC